MDIPKHASLIRRGYATHLLLAVIALVLFPVVAMYLISMLESVGSVRIGIANQVSYLDLYNKERIAIEQVLNYVNLTNVGSKPVSIQFIALKTGSGVSLYRVEDFSNGCTLLKPAERCSIQLDQNATVIAIVTTSGVVVKPRVLSSNIAIVPTIEMYTLPLQNLSLPWDLTRLFNVSPDLVRDPHPRYVHGGGAKNKSARGIEGPWVFVLNRSLGFRSKEQMLIKANKIPFGIAVIGYDPTWLSRSEGEPRFRILLTGHLWLRRCGKDRLCIYEGPGNAPQFLRLKLYNFSGEIRIYQNNELIACAPYPSCANSENVRNAIGFWYYGYDYDVDLKIYIDGNITALREYVVKERGKASSGITSYDPYLFIADTDGNNLTEFILITEDVGYGTEDRINDRFKLGRHTINLITKSAEPLTLILNLSTVTGEIDGSIPGDKYSGLYLYINMYFHDNSYPDSKQLEDNPDTLPIIQVALINQNGHEYIVREYEYQEIANYHQTLIKNLRDGETKYFTKLSQTIYVPIPQKEKYWLAIKLQDPYYLIKYYWYRINDADFTIGLEYIGVILVMRK